MKKRKKKELPPVNCKDEAEMIALGYRNPLKPRDKTVWTKTKTEKNMLKRAKRIFRGYQFSSSWSFTKPAIPCYGKLIVQIYKDKKFMNKNNIHPSHSTFSFDCGQSDIPFILSKFLVPSKDGSRSIVRWYKWNGTQYGPEELPFYYW